MSRDGMSKDVTYARKIYHLLHLTYHLLQLGIDCEQSLFCLKIRGEERKTSEHASVTARVTCEVRVARASLLAALLQPRSQSPLSTSRKYPGYG